MLRLIELKALKVIYNLRHTPRLEFDTYLMHSVILSKQFELIKFLFCIITAIKFVFILGIVTYL